MPAAKKHPSARARANRASTAAALSSTPRVGRTPDLPDAREDGWSDQTRAWWRDIWASPMSSEYHPSDRHQMVVLAYLMDDFFTATSRSMRTAIAAEIRFQRMAFGMTPYDRRRLEWTIEVAEDAKDKGTARRARTGTAQPKPADDPRRALSAVN